MKKINRENPIARVKNSERKKLYYRNLAVRETRSNFTRKLKTVIFRGVEYDMENFRVPFVCWQKPGKINRGAWLARGYPGGDTTKKQVWKRFSVFKYNGSFEDSFDAAVQWVRDNYYPPK